MSKVTAGLLAAILVSLSLGFASANVVKPKLAHKPIVIATPTPSPSPTPAGYVTIPGGTPLHVTLVGKVSSSNANVGDTFAIQAADNVVVDGWIVITKGAVGQGEVATVDRAGSHGHPGTLGIQMDWIFAADGEKLHLTSQRDTSEGEGKQGASSTLTVVSWLALGLPGLFAHNFVHGRDIDIDGSKQLDAFTQDTAHIVSPTKAADDGFAH